MELIKAIYERRSIRKYKEHQMTENEVLEIIKAAQMAPSWKNSQTPRYFVALRLRLLMLLPTLTRKERKTLHAL